MSAALPLPPLKQRAVHAFAWSALQSWTVKAFTLLVFLLLARRLGPADLGLAQGVLVLLAFIAVLAMQGWPPALVQQPELQREDVNLPFVLSLGTALAGAAVLLLAAEPIARALGAPGAAPLLRAAAPIPPLAAASGVLVALHRRRLEFGHVARATLLAHLAGGAAALGLAWRGYGAGCLVGQALATAATLALLLWRAPVWRPGGRFTRGRLGRLSAYAGPAYAGQLLDFCAGRAIELVILSRHGLAALGTYAVGAKLYLTLLELLAAALVEPALAALSRLAGDRARLQRAYRRLVFLAACTTAPLFVGVAALAPELCTLLFGPRWTGADVVARWLALLGAVQAVQYVNSAVLGAAGRAGTLLGINAAKLGAGLLALALTGAGDAGGMTLAFVLGQLAVAPLSFGLALHATGLRGAVLAAQLVPGGLGAGAAFGLVTALRPLLDADLAPAARLLLLGGAYTLALAALLGLLCGRRLRAEWRDLAPAWRQGGPAA